VVQAALSQDHPDFEVIVVDNASTDRTAQIAARFPVAVIHEAHKGILHAREAGRRAATGDIIANLDADCTPAPNWLSTGVAAFADQNVAAVSGPYDYHDARRSFRLMSNFLQKYVYSVVSRGVTFFNLGGMIVGGNALIRASVLDTAGGYNTDILFYGEDTDTAKRIAKHGKIIFDKKFTVRSSARRFQVEGDLKVMFTYFFHFFKVTFSGLKNR
jgi:cellulose synthase/poly-beta-1,6-N-acetylglucosamine synthase-like glycosyltransferase